MIEGLILVEGDDLSEETLRSVSLGNALQLVVGREPRGGVILHIAADSAAYLSDAMLRFAEVRGVTRVLTLALQTSH